MGGIGAKNRNPRNWTAARAKVREESECRVCGSIHDLEAAHLAPRSIGGGDSPDGIVPLCRLHHRAFDTYRLDLLPHVTYEEQAEAVRVMGIERARRRLAPSSYGGRRG